MSDMDVTEENIGGVPELKSKLPTWAKCSVCCNAAVGDAVRLMPCLHLICSADCLNKARVAKPKLAHKNSVYCDSCGKSHSVTELKTNAYLLEHEEKERIQEAIRNFKHPTCTYCIRGSNAASWCAECDEHMCSSCLEHHAYATRTRDHKTVKVDPSSTLPKMTSLSCTMCQLHRTPVTMFCSSCNSSFCVLCKKRHEGHATESLKDMANETKSNIQRSLDQIRNMLPKYEHMEDVLNNKAQQMVDTQYTFLITEASAQLTRLLSALMKREMEQRKELADTVIHKTKELNLKRQKILTLISQTQSFVSFCDDLLKDGSDWAIISNRQLVESQFYHLLTSAGDFSKDGSMEAYTEKGFNFMMDKTVGHQAERHINVTAKITYTFNPKAPSEIKLNSELQSRNLRSTGVTANDSITSTLQNRSKVAQKPSTSQALRSYAKSPKSIDVSQASNEAGASSNAGARPPRIVQRNNSPGSLAEYNMAKIAGASSVVDQYANLTDQLIIEAVDDESEIEDDGAIDHKSDGDETDVLQENNDEQPDTIHGSKYRSKRGRPSRDRQASAAKNQNANGGKSSKKSTPKELGSENAAVSDSDSEEGSRNAAPNLTPESMKTPPRLRRVAESRKTEASAGDDTENPMDVPPPVLVPSVNITNKGTPGVKTAASVGARRKSDVSAEVVLNEEKSNPEESSSEPTTRRSRRRSGTQNTLLTSEDVNNPGPSTRRSLVDLTYLPGPVTRRRRSRSRDRAEDDSPPPSEVLLPSKRERKKKSDPQFVQDSLVSKKRSRTSQGPETPPTPSTPLSSPENKRGRPRGSSGRGRRRRRSAGRPRKNAVATELDDDSYYDVPAEVLDFPLVREDRMRISGNDAADSNEDYCNVCQDGGDGDLLCCDLCPKVYHLKCHMPIVELVPDGDWQCLFCTERNDILSLPESEDDSFPPGSLQNKNTREFMIACKFLSEIFSIKESLVTRTYFETLFRLKKQRHPSSLNHIRSRLTHMTPNPYTTVKEMVGDLRLMFTQAYELYDRSSDEYGHTKKFESKFLEICDQYSSVMENVFTDPQGMESEHSA